MPLPTGPWLFFPAMMTIFLVVFFSSAVRTVTGRSARSSTRKRRMGCLSSMSGAFHSRRSHELPALGFPTSLLVCQLMELLVNTELSIREDGDEPGIPSSSDLGSGQLCRGEVGG